MTDVPKIGGLYEQRVGRHKGTVNRVKGVSQGWVFMETVTPGASFGSTHNSERYATDYKETLEAFGARWTPVSRGSNGTQTAFRRTAQPKPKTEEATREYKPALGVISQHDQLNISIETVTPVLAAEWLARGGLNRKLRDRWVDSLAAAITRGEWELTGESIKLDEDGKVRDGQNRLAAVVKSGIPIQTVVVRGVGESAFNVMDTGKSRNVAEIVGMRGYPSSTGLSAAVRTLLMLERFGKIAQGGRDAATSINSVTTLKYLEKYPDTLEGFRLGDTVRAAGLQGGMGIWGAVFTLFWRISSEQAYEFAQLLIYGENMERFHPALMLRNRAMNRQAGYARSPAGREELAAMIIKSWNAFRQGKSIEYLAYRTGGRRAESFPTPV